MKNISYNQVEGYKTLKDLLNGSAEKFGSMPAFKQKGIVKENEEATNIIEEYSYAGFKEDVYAFGTTLINYNLHSKHIGLIGETSYEWICAYFAIVCGGGVVVPIDKEASTAEIEEIMQASGCVAFIYSATFTVLAQHLMKTLPKVEDYVNLQGNYKDWLEMGKKALANDNTAYDKITINPEKMSTILFTSGTTGKSKGVMLTNKSIMAVAEGALQIIDIGGVCLSVLPIHHSYEFSHGIIMMLERGVCICINDSLRYFVQNLQLFKPTMVCIVPLFVEMMYKKIWDMAKSAGIEAKLLGAIKQSNELLAQGTDKREEFFADILNAFGGNLRLILCGGSPLSPKLMRAMREFGIMLINGYGITECSPLVAVNSQRKFKDGSVGIPIGCMEIEIREADEDGNGDIWVKGENVMLGYYQNPVATKEAIVDGWFNTGDIGYIDSDGFLFITGRRKNLIVLNSGKNIFPEELEEHYLKIPYIKEIVVFAKATEGVFEDALCAEVFIDETFAKDFTKEELNAKLKADTAKINKEIPHYKQVHIFTIRDTEFEKTTKKSIKRFKINNEEEI